MIEFYIVELLCNKFELIDYLNIEEADKSEGDNYSYW